MCLATGRIVSVAIVALILLMAAEASFGVGDLQEKSLARVELQGSKDVHELLQMGIDIDDVREDYVEAYVTEAEIEFLRSRGYVVVRVPNYAKIYSDSLWEATKDSDDPLAAYHSYSELTAELQSIAASHPDICHLESIGQSVNGRDLWFLKITDNVSVQEDEPEFKYISTMHGDEPVGTELCMYLINYLVDNYGSDDQATFLVDETEIWIMPLMNPDGYIAHTRNNAHDVNLNRNFPDPITDPNNTPDGREPETQAVMYFCFDQSSVLSANFHTGALVVNYPWDCQYPLTPDDDLFIDVSLAYARLNGPMYNSATFDSGITNGAQWYVIHGGMQDWNYHWLACNEVTIELSDVKWPDASTLPGFWEDNRESMLAYMERCHRGVRGVVTDSSTGSPVAATVNVMEIGKEVFTDPDVGDYHRLALPGTYTFHYAAAGYFSKTVHGVEVVADSATRLDVALRPAPRHVLSGTITSRDSGDSLEATVSLVSSWVDTSVVSDLPLGHYSIELFEGTYRIKVLCEGYGTVVDTVDLNQELELDFQLEETEVQTYVNTTPLSIPDNYPPGVTGFLNVPDTLEISEVDVYVNITHTFIGDLIVRITSPEGTMVTLHNRSGGTTDNLITWFDDQTEPDGPGGLDDFIGEMSDGQWALWISDNAGVDIGTLNQWQLRIEGIDRGGVSAEEDVVEVPGTFSLGQNYPNPFNPATVIPFAVPPHMRNVRPHVTLTVYNLLGQLVRTLADAPHDPGHHRVAWDGRDGRGQEVASGVYLFRLRAEDVTATRRAVLLR